MNKLVLLSLVVVSVAACGKKKEPMGACIVEYDGFGTTGTACTVDSEAKCQTVDEPPLRPGSVATLKLKSFAVGKSCMDVGYATGGCADVAIAWTFHGKCPQ